MRSYVNWARREFSMRQRLIALGFEGLFFLLLLPFLLYAASTAIDNWLQVPKFNAGTVNAIAGLLLILGGLFLAMWSIQTQVMFGAGTPVPLMPTRRLIVSGPFAFCSNPMTLGTYIAYTGLGVWIGSFSAVALVVLLTALLLAYVKFLEEKELEARFGSEYLEYKRRTPFILPRFNRQS
ncbi:MAG: hypothetical protein M1281_02725 [Chloroflexi bacterium]|nr:hypothetical protein [Chloroflexota bacterium]